MGRVPRPKRQQTARTTTMVDGPTTTTNTGAAAAALVKAATHAIVSGDSDSVELLVQKRAGSLTSGNSSDTETQNFDVSSEPPQISVEMGLLPDESSPTPSLAAISNHSNSHSTPSGAGGDQIIDDDDNDSKVAVSSVASSQLFDKPIMDESSALNTTSASGRLGAAPLETSNMVVDVSLEDGLLGISPQKPEHDIERGKGGGGVAFYSQSQPYTAATGSYDEGPPNAVETSMQQQQQTPDEEKEETEEKHQGTRWGRLALILVILIAIIVGISVAVQKSKSRSGATTTSTQSAQDGGGSVAPTSSPVVTRPPTHPKDESSNDQDDDRFTFPPTKTPAPIKQPISPYVLSDAPSQVPSRSPEASPDYLYQLLLRSIIETVTPSETLDQPETPQARAFDFMTKQDAHFNYTKTPSQELILSRSDASYDAFSEKVLQRYALITLDMALQGESSDLVAPQSLLRTGAATVDECDWLGVICSPRNLTVSSNASELDASIEAAFFFQQTHPNIATKLKWPALGLAGDQIPDEIRVLSSLKVLDLGENQIGGVIPDSIFELTDLRELYLHSNRFRGTLSENFSKLQKLVTFYAGNNQLEGPIPKGLGSPGLGGANARPLRSLSLHKNRISGEIPSLLNWRHMWYLDLSYNQIGGSFPDDWVNNNNRLGRIRHLYLDHNQFRGELPANLFTMGNGRIEQLYLNNNQFQGVVPGNLEIRNHLQHFEVHHNQFTGLTKDICQLPVWIGGEMVNFRADCSICICKYFCQRDECYRY